MRMTVMYTAFAIAAIAANLITQSLILHLVRNQYAISCAILGGTMAGLALKYLLDKQWIFMHEHVNATQNARTFVLYSMMGIVTTLIFWLAELTATHLSASSLSRNIGAILGLTVGYYVKYKLDKKFVFVTRV
jgi:hypothetical protein